MAKNNIIQKVAALVMVLIGLLAMLVAWELLLVSDIHNSTVIVLEMGGVVVCMTDTSFGGAPMSRKRTQRGKFRRYYLRLKNIH